VSSAQPSDNSAIGVSKWDLDTPALCVDLDKLDQNIAALRTGLAGTGVASRPHAKTHRCPDIAKRQLSGGSIGICAAKLGEAEALFAGGIEPILMTTACVTPGTIGRAMRLRAANPRFIQAVDHPQNARDLSDAARQAGVTADVVMDVAIGTRSGVPPDERAIALAQLVDSLPNLMLRGLVSYDGSAQHIKGFATRRDETLRRFQPSIAIFEAMRRAGLNTEIFSGGGTGTWSIMAKVSGVTDVQVGSYIFMDCQYLEIGCERNDALNTDFTTVLNDYFPHRLTTDAGTKALTLNKPGPIVVGEPGFAYDANSDEFGVIQYEAASRSYRVGDRLELVVPHCDPVVNEYDRIYATRHDRVEAVWPVSARGRSQ